MKRAPCCASARHQGPLCCWEDLSTQVSHEAVAGRRGQPMPTRLLRQLFEG
jgi:hypothetical protein